MRTLATWSTDDPCPGCGAVLVLLDDGSGPLAVECRSCGTADTWTSIPAGGDR
jgi:hypothetical protein